MAESFPAFKFWQAKPRTHAQLNAFAVALCLDYALRANQSTLVGRNLGKIGLLHGQKDFAVVAT